MNRETLKKWFRTGAKPTEAQFAELIESFRHVDEQLSVSDVENLSALIAEKMTRADALALHEKLLAEIAKIDEEKTTAGDVQAMINATHAEEPWGAENDANDYTETGVYQFAGWRKNPADNLPITNYDEDEVERNNVAFTLVVNVQEGYFDASVPRNIPTMIAQTLMLGNRRGSDTKIYTRHGQTDLNTGATTWEAWREVLTSVFLGITDSYTGDVLNSATEIGLYTGAVVDMANVVADVFKLEVMNNYSVTTQVSAAMGVSVPNSVLQTLTLLTLSGVDVVRRRTGVWNGNGYVWSEWEATENNTAETAGQDKTGVVKGGRNVRIDQDGSVNVDELLFKHTDTDTSDGVLDDGLLRVNPNVTVEDAMISEQEYQKKDKASTSTLSEYVQKQICGDDSMLTAVSGIDYNPFDHTTAISTIRTGEERTLVSNIWGDILSEYEYLKNNVYKDYNYLKRLWHGLGLYPYYGGSFEFEISDFMPLDEYGNTIHVPGLSFYLENNLGEIIGEFPCSPANESVRTLTMSPEKFTKNGEAVNDLSTILPLKVVVRNTGANFSYNGIKLTIQVWQVKSPSGGTKYWNQLNARYLYGHFQSIVDNTDSFTNMTKNVVVCRDGILLQGRNQSCYIRINAEGNIETNIGEFITQ